jgi:hypothetical protein
MGVVALRERGAGCWWTQGRKGQLQYKTLLDARSMPITNQLALKAKTNTLKHTCLRSLSCGLTCYRANGGSQVYKWC